MGKGRSGRVSHNKGGFFNVKNKEKEKVETRSDNSVKATRNRVKKGS